MGIVVPVLTRPDGRLGRLGTVAVVVTVAALAGVRPGVIKASAAKAEPAITRWIRACRTTGGEDMWNSKDGLMPPASRTRYPVIAEPW